jgi:RND family efflux transporter MFP subunit
LLDFGWISKDEGETVSSPSSKAALTLLTSVLATACMLAGCEPGNKYIPPPPAEVIVSTPVRRSVMSYMEYTGTTKAIETVDLRARVKGFLKQRLFREGEEVKQGQLLLVIDEEPFQVTLEIAQARLEAAQAGVKKAEESKAREVAKAQLDLDQAAYQLAKVEETRQRALLRRNAGSQEDLDKAEADRKKAGAQVEADRAHLEQARADYVTNLLNAKANVAQAEAEVRNAKLDLGYCRISAPFDGRISRSYFDLQNLVGDSQATVLATIVKFDPIYAYMSVSESDLLMFRKLVREGKRVDFRKEPIALDLGLPNETGFPHRGVIDYTDPTVDPGSGTIQARGKFPNPGPNPTIYPGLFCRIRVPLATTPDALLVPQRSLAYDQGGWYLLVVGSGNKVEQRYVTPGAVEGSLRVIDENLKPDDLVIVQGLQRARPGIVVKPQRQETTVANVGKVSVPIDTKPLDTPARASSIPAGKPTSASSKGPGT